MYTIIHHYLTVGDDGQPTVEVESQTVEVDLISPMVARMVADPGGRSGTTITLTVSLNQPTSI